ncbi:MAG: NAD kinase [Rhizobiales bacterium 65-9]|nr:NAD kinase [Hyphomicrobiales bacterium]OJY32455.1 MAG: NAD kinase [Rhizobiales bacterium 65-9]
MPTLAFVDSSTPEAQAARIALAARYGDAPPEDADVIVALGGDGLMLQTLHAQMGTGKPIYGMNRGSVGFLMNEYREDNLMERISAAHRSVIHPIVMRATGAQGRQTTSRAINEVSMLRKSYQAAKLRISVDGKMRLDELICDGLIISTPAGSTAYNLSANGPILPLNAPLLAVTPISPFRPRRWRGALLPDRARVTVAVMEAEKRPVNAVADHIEVNEVLAVEVSMDHAVDLVLLHDPGHSLDERIINEQFNW